jgi:hypothetical protein
MASKRKGKTKGKRKATPKKKTRRKPHKAKAHKPKHKPPKTKRQRTPGTKRQAPSFANLDKAIAAYDATGGNADEGPHVWSSDLGAGKSWDTIAAEIRGALTESIDDAGYTADGAAAVNVFAGAIVSALSGDDGDRDMALKACSAAVTASLADLPSWAGARLFHIEATGPQYSRTQDVLVVEAADHTWHTFTYEYVG